MRNKKLLESFTAHCLEHPEERFWQALRNWAKVEFIFTSKHPLFHYEQDGLQDTFYWEEKTK
jgi:hypothetical protein